MSLKQPARHFYRLWMKTRHKPFVRIWVSPSGILWQDKLTLLAPFGFSYMPSLDRVSPDDLGKQGLSYQTYIRVHLFHPPACRTIPPWCWLWPLPFSCRRCRVASCVFLGQPLSLMELQHILQNRNQLGGEVRRNVREKKRGISYPILSTYDPIIPQWKTFWFNTSTLWQQLSLKCQILRSFLLRGINNS